MKMVIFHSYVNVYQRVIIINDHPSYIKGQQKSRVVVSALNRCRHFHRGFGANWNFSTKKMGDDDPDMRCSTSILNGNIMIHHWI